MRRYIRALILCMVFAVFSALYVYSKLFYADLSVGGGGGRNVLQRAAAAPNPRDSGHGSRRGPDKKGPADQHWYIMRKAEGHAGVVGGAVPEQMHLAVVTCGQRLEETLTMLKSAVMFSIKPLRLHIFADDQLHASFIRVLESWPGSLRPRFSYSVYPITFPRRNAGEWKKLFKLCASQRLFLPGELLCKIPFSVGLMWLILKELDSLVYVDSDILFLQPVDALWSLLAHFNDTQLAAMAPEHEEPRIAWYNRFARHPYYGRTGVNSGVMLMNVTRIRATYFRNDMTSVGLRWEELLMPLLQKYKLNITWGDQDLLNIIFHHNPECLLEIPCHWNYRPDHCIYGSNCVSAEEEGVFVLHGNRGVYHDLKQPAFRAVYDAIRQYSFGEDPVGSLLMPLEEELLKTTSTYCSKSHVLFTKRLSHSLANVNRDPNKGPPHGG
ncbi:glucoside xylosyltransferase 1 isoform X2 [Esox lucius]|uniref:glucoside xylosyltransferase 1 isoform X2 n=1 Tax=Esox lucius TaxID=8010 RepID=UPI001477662F|nr:glucoside xylosyltransferase 1 isoform X2 [Esox lucius]